MTIRFALALAVSLSSSSAGAAGLELSGTVLDVSGQGLTGVSLTLVHQDSGWVREASSGAAGHYLLSAIPPGEYTLEARLQGYATSRFAGLRYFADTKPIFNITLRLRDVQESMTFTGEAPLINVSQSQVGQSVEARQLHELPLERRDYLELVGASGSAHEIQASPPERRAGLGSSQLSVNGAGALYTSYELDGFDNTRDQHGVAMVDVDIEAIEEFRVLSGQFSAEYGGSLAGIVSAATPSGANDIHGSVYGYFRPGAWDANDTLTQDGRALDRQELGVTLSGPLGSDRTQLFASATYRNQDEDVIVTAPFDGGRFQGVFDLPSDRVRVLVKLSHALSSRHQLTLQGLFADQSAVDGVGGFDVFENARSMTNEDGALFGNLVSDLGAMLSDFRIGFSLERFRASSQAPPLGSVQIHPTLGTIGNPTRLERVDEDHFELSETLSWTRGDHNLKAGGSFVHIGSVSELHRYDDGVDFFSPSDARDPILRWQSTASSSGSDILDRSENHVQLFIGDDWQTSPYVTLNLGLRWERESSVPDNDNVSPRVGIHWDATHDGRTSIRGGFGIFYGNVFSIVDSLESLYGPQGRGVIATANLGTSPPMDSPRNLYVDAPRYSKQSRQAPGAQHFTGGIERELWSGFSAAVDLSHIRGYDLIVPRDLNAPVFFDYTGGAIRTSVEADATRPFGTPGGPVSPGTALLPDGFPFDGYRDLYVLASSGTSRYWGVKVNLTKRYASDFMLQAVYNWSRTDNDGDDFRVRESLPLDPSRSSLEWGRSAFDIPSSLVINSVWDAPFDIRVTGLFRLRSGRPIDPRVDQDLDGDLKLRERAASAGAILARNSFRLPASATLDVSFTKLLELDYGRTLSFALDVFNLTNRLNPLQYLSTYGRGATPLGTFAEIVQAGPPRQFQLSTRFSF